MSAFTCILAVSVSALEWMAKYTCTPRVCSVCGVGWGEWHAFPAWLWFHGCVQGFVGPAAAVLSPSRAGPYLMEPTRERGRSRGASGLSPWGSPGPEPHSLDPEGPILACAPLLEPSSHVPSVPVRASAVCHAPGSWFQLRWGCSEGLAGG